MYALWDMLAVIGLFLLRLGVPLLLSVGIGYWLVRLDRRRQVAGMGRPCWERRECPPEQRSRCLAFQHPDIPCWAIVRATEGELRSQCATCSVFAPRPAASPR